MPFFTSAWLHGWCQRASKQRERKPHMTSSMFFGALSVDLMFCQMTLASFLRATEANVQSR